MAEWCNHLRWQLWKVTTTTKDGGNDDDDDEEEEEEDDDDNDDDEDDDDNDDDDDDDDEEDSNISNPVDKMKKALEIGAAKVKAVAKKAVRGVPKPKLVLESHSVGEVLAVVPIRTVDSAAAPAPHAHPQDALLAHRNADLAAKISMKMEMIQLELEVAVNQWEATKEFLAKEQKVKAHDETRREKEQADAMLEVTFDEAIYMAWLQDKKMNLLLYPDPAVKRAKFEAKEKADAEPLDEEEVDETVPDTLTSIFSVIPISGVAAFEDTYVVDDMFTGLVVLPILQMFFSSFSVALD
ncbi:protein bfr2-like [Humulus lupulus]|uniref:protein bfr2-like n=1 Tax=Humulus lupulus TaxID=3486 RepID=UPI002B4099A5|nr:protein bfr2-like [Humulus lupulus]